MCIADDNRVGVKVRKPPLAKLAPGADLSVTKSMLTSAPKSTSLTASDYIGGGTPESSSASSTAAHQATPITTGPLGIPTPDATSVDAVQARLRERQQIEQLAGYRGTFLSGPRGPGGPSLAQQREQLRPPPGLVYSPVRPPGQPPPIAVPPGGGGSAPPGDGGTGGGDTGGGGTGGGPPGGRLPPPLPFLAARNTTDEYLVDPMTGVVKRNPNYRRPMVYR